MKVGTKITKIFSKIKNALIRFKDNHFYIWFPRLEQFIKARQGKTVKYWSSSRKRPSDKSFQYRGYTIHMIYDNEILFVCNLFVEDFAFMSPEKESIVTKTLEEMKSILDDK